MHWNKMEVLINVLDETGLLPLFIILCIALIIALIMLTIAFAMHLKRTAKISSEETSLLKIRMDGGVIGGSEELKRAETGETYIKLSSRKMKIEPLDMLYAKENGFVICKYCETMNSASRPDCIACCNVLLW